MNKAKIIIFFFGFSILLLSAVQVIVSNQLSTNGVLMDKIEKETNYYKTENIILSERVSLASSLTNIALKASNLGFVEEKAQYVVTSSLPLAIRQ